MKLKASREDVDIKILETGGLFKKAKVLVSISPDCLEKYNRVRALREQEKESFESQEKKVEIQEVEISQTKEKDEKQSELEIGKEFLEGFAKTLNFDIQVDADEQDEEIYFYISGKDSANLIGYRGECLNNLQFILSVLVGKNNRKSKKVRIDIDNYREKRKETLIALAHRVAKKVQKTGYQTKLEPMTAYERRIIHTVIQEYPDLTSVSKGEEPHRYLIIKKEK